MAKDDVIQFEGEVVEAATSSVKTLIEAKKATFSEAHGMQQALDYASALGIPFVFASNGKGFVSPSTMALRPSRRVAIGWLKASNMGYSFARWVRNACDSAAMALSGSMVSGSTDGSIRSSRPSP